MRLHLRGLSALSKFALWSSDVKLMYKCIYLWGIQELLTLSHRIQILFSNLLLLLILLRMIILRLLSSIIITRIFQGRFCPRLLDDHGSPQLPFSTSLLNHPFTQMCSKSYSIFTLVLYLNGKMGCIKRFLASPPGN